MSGHKARSVKLGLINIKLHPHSDEIYRSLLRDAGGLRQIIKISGIDCACLALLGACDDDCLSGEIMRFVNIDPRDKWLNVFKREPVDPDSGEVPKIPEELKPRLREARFAFFPKSHKLVYDAGKIGSKAAVKFFQIALNVPDLKDKYGEAVVVGMQSKDVIDQILALKGKSRIIIRITRPNGDDITDQRARMMQRFENQNVGEYTETLSAAKNAELLPDEETQNLMNIARTDGCVTVKSRDENGRVSETSTKEHPCYFWEDAEDDSREAFDVAALAALGKCTEQIREESDAMADGRDSSGRVG